MTVFSVTRNALAQHVPLGSAGMHQISYSYGAPATGVLSGFARHDCQTVSLVAMRQMNLTEPFLKGLI
ncbi:MAG TPA: hypothetical protein VJ577_11310 [Burkholderiaceae bacterium]|nr:hypothetical protein [Burkholderiaceae bacterium]